MPPLISVSGPELLLSDVILYINYELLARKLGGGSCSLAVLERHFPLTVAWFNREVRMEGRSDCFAAGNSDLSTYGVTQGESGQISVTL